jgi:hypothetical protein
MDAFDVDQVLFQYARAAKELWKFCNLGDPELVAGLLPRPPTRRLVGTRGAERALSASSAFDPHAIAAAGRLPDGLPDRMVVCRSGSCSSS